MKLLFVGDVHLADRPPGKRDAGYHDDIFRKLQEIGTIIRKTGAEAVLFAGDIFHHKPPRETSHRTVQKLINLFEAYGVPVLICVGNHDISEYRLESLEKQPLGVLATAKNVTLLSGAHTEMFKGVALHSIPGVRGVTIDNYDFPVDESVKWNVLVAHQSVVPDKSKLPAFLRDKDFMHDSQEVANVTKCNVVLYGHEHARHGVYKRTNAAGEPVVFVNLGAISRGTIDESDLKKEPAVYLLDFKPDGLAGGEYKLKNVRAIEDCYLLEEHFQKVDHKQATEDAINSLKDTRLERFSVESVIADIEVRDDITTDVRDAALELLEPVR